MRHKLFAIALWLATFGPLFGCGTATTVLGGCEMPAAYDVVKPLPAPLTATDLKGHLEQEAQERHTHAADVQDFNGLHDYVKDKCK